MKKIIITFLTAIIMMQQISISSALTKKEDKQDFKVIGYYSELLFDDPVDEVLQWDKLTHVMYAFLIPKEDGTFENLAKPERLKEIVEKAHKNKVKVFIALGGWSYKDQPLDPVFEKLAANEESRRSLSKNLLKFVVENNLDGVEIDWEYPDLGESALNYEKLVLQIKKDMSSQKKEVTAALNGAWSKTEGPEVSKAVSEKCLKAFDFITVMSYDTNNDNHAPYSHAETSIAYWVNRGVSSKKIVLGMPLYARPSWKQYRHIVAENPENAYRDFSQGATPEMNSYYNGLNTIGEKTRMCLKTAGGVMLFDINEDAQGDLSVTKRIKEMKDYFNKNEVKFKETIWVNYLGREIPLSEYSQIGEAKRDSKGRILLPLEFSKLIGSELPYEEKIVIGDKIYVPARFALESLGYKITWVAGSQVLKIENK